MTAGLGPPKVFSETTSVHNMYSSGPPLLFGIFSGEEEEWTRRLYWKAEGVGQPALPRIRWMRRWRAFGFIANTACGLQERAGRAAGRAGRIGKSPVRRRDQTRDIT
jgi:hypothetical protein